MSLKSIVVAASGEAEDDAVLATAARLASRFGADARVVPVFPDPAADLVYYGASLHTSPQAAERIATSEREMQAQIEQQARKAAAAEAVSMTVEKRALQPAVALAPAAVLADLVLFGAGAAQSPALGGLFAEILLSTRAPILLVRSADTAPAPIAVAWDGSPQAARAARAALPLLQAAPRVLIVHNVDDETAEAAAGNAERLQTYLRLHGVANIETREVRGERVAASLLDAAKAEGCGVLVAGAFGRPRLFEMVLGGTTRALVQASGGPHVLFAH